MKKTFLFSFILSLFIFASCKKDETTVSTPTPSDAPVGTFTAARAGSLTAQSGTVTGGKVEIGVDTKGTQFLHLVSDFKSDFHTGAVTLYFSKGATYSDAGVKSVSLVNKNGEQFFKVTPSVSNDFTHLIVWCGVAKIPFGVAELK